MLEVVMGLSEILVLKESKLFNEEDIIGFSALSSMKKINNIYNETSREISYCKINVKKEINNLREKVKNYKEIRIWYSSIDNEELCNLHLIIDLLKDNDILIHAIDVGKEKVWSISCYHESQIKDLLKYDLIISQEEKNNYINTWNNLLIENKDLRIIENGILKSYDYEYLDLRIKEILKKIGEIKYIGLIGRCIANEICNFHESIIFESRTEYLINKKEIIITKIQKEKNFMNEEKDVKYIKLNVKE